jgi:hypothetical protein
MSCSSRKKISRAVQQGRPYAHATTRLTLRTSAMIAAPPDHRFLSVGRHLLIGEVPRSRAHAVHGAGRATNSKHRAPIRVGPYQPGGICRAPTSPTANRSPSLSPPINAIDHLRRSARAELMREAREIRRRTTKSGSGHKPPPARRNGQECEKLQKVPCRRGAGRKDKLLESPDFLCELGMFHLAAGQPCVMRWQNREHADWGSSRRET